MTEKTRNLQMERIGPACELLRQWWTVSATKTDRKVSLHDYQQTYRGQIWTDVKILSLPNSQTNHKSANNVYRQIYF